MISYQLEPLFTFVPNLAPLMEEHYKEIGDSSLEPHLDLPLYQGFETGGNLPILTVREDGKMIGYVVVFVKQHPHYKELCGFEDAYFLSSQARKRGVGREMIEKMLEHLKARGVKKVFFHSKKKSSHKELFTTLGFGHSDEIWARKL